MNTFFLRDTLNRSPIKQNDPALYQVINALLEGTELIPEWQEWSPNTINLTVGNGRLTGRFIRFNSTSVIATLYFLFGSTSSITGTVRFSAPLRVLWNPYVASNPVQSNLCLGPVSAFDFSTGNRFVGFMELGISTSSQFITPRVLDVNSVAQVVNATFPFTWAVDDSLTATFVYETDEI